MDVNAVGFDTLVDAEPVMTEEIAGMLTEIVPKFRYSRRRNWITLYIQPVIGADGYEIYICKGSSKTLVLTTTDPVVDFNQGDDLQHSYEVRAFRKLDSGTEYSKFSERERIDAVSDAKNQNSSMLKLLEELKNAGQILCQEDLEIARKTLETAAWELKEKERRRQEEEEAEKRRLAIEKERQRRAAEAKRRREIREQKRREHIKSVTSLDLPMDWTNAYEEDDRADEQCESSADGLMKSLDMLGLVDIEFIAAITGKAPKDVIIDLKGAIYQNPLFWDENILKGWETADAYLSGNLMHKYQVAVRENKTYNGYFQSNVTAIEGLLDTGVDADEIYVALGSPWIPTDVIDDFIAFMAHKGNLTGDLAKQYFSMVYESKYAVLHDPYTGRWVIPEKGRFKKSCNHGAYEDACFNVYGTDDMDMMAILERSLNLRTIEVYQITGYDPAGKPIRVLDQQGTLLAVEKQKFMNKTFQEWVWQDDRRKARLLNAYNEQFGYVRTRHFDGSFLSFPEMNPEVKLYDYQKNAVARILFSPNTLLAHDVGSGKTYVMIAAGMENKRLRSGAKNMYVIPNGIIGQWEDMFKRIYPKARIFVISHRNFTPAKRNDILNQIKTENYDAILITYSCFELINLSDRYYIRLYQERIKLLKKAEKYMQGKVSYDAKIKKYQQLIEDLKKTYKQTPKYMPFDELGITNLFVDESHNFKNIHLQSSISRVRGLSKSGSKRGVGMLDKVHCVQRMNNGGGVVFATATPVTNSLSDLYTVQKYLQEGELEFNKMSGFDAWVGMFAETSTEFEIDLDTQNYRLVNRFSRFCNIPELTAMIASVVDFHTVDKSAEIPELEACENSVSAGNDDFSEYLNDISRRADDVRKRRVSSTEDNMLKITSDGRKAALDMRLVDEAFGLDSNSKVIRLAENVAEIYENSRKSKGTQLVFCDISTPKESFNLYDDMAKLMVLMGVPRNEIAFIHDADKETTKDELFRKVRSGKIAVLIGSTAKMGHGMNVQKHIVALHHLDVPWRPSDMIQREGRMLRQGNENDKVKIYRYITKSSFDAYSWQLLEKKQRFISQIMSGEAKMRSGSDIDETVLSYAEVKALAVGNPKIKERVELINELDRYRILQHEIFERNKELALAKRTLPIKIDEQKQRVAECERDMEYLKIHRRTYSEEERRRIRKTIYHAIRDNRNNPEETEVLKYNGFRVVIPAYMVPRSDKIKEIAADTGDEVTSVTCKEISYVHLINNGCYYLEIGNEAGITKRLDNFFEKFERQKENRANVLKNLEARLKDLEDIQTNEEDGYIGKIQELENRIQLINEELGIDGPDK